MKKTYAMTLRLTLSVALIFSFIVAQTPVATSQYMQNHYEEVHLLRGDVHAVPVSGLTRVSVTDPTVADITDATEDEVLVVAKEAGQTVLFVWENGVKRTVMVRVTDEDLGILKARIKHLLRKAEIYGVYLEESKYEGRIILTGDVTEEDKEQLDELMENFDDDIINLVKVRKIEDMIEIDVQITELSQTLTETLGFNWSDSLNYTETLPGNLDGLRDFFKVGKINRTTQLTTTVNALVQEGKGRVLSQPKLVVANGKEASFLVGGEIPIRSTTTSTTGSTVVEDVEFKEYGVNMIITPTIRNDKIDILLNVEITDIDLATTQSVSGTNSGDEVAFTAREAQTNLFLDDGQTIVLAGLIKRNESEQVEGVPGLRKIPILGLAFRKRTQSVPVDTELVITLTPRVIKVRPSQEDAMAKELTMQQDHIDESHYDEARHIIEHAHRQSSDMVSSISKTMSTTSTLNMPANMGPYTHEIQRRISQSIAYPYEARKFGWQGTVKLDLRILKDGTLKDITLRETSGHHIFDQDAVHTAQILAPYAPLPDYFGLDELVVTIPIIYSLDPYQLSSN